jgi:RNA polymerase sigma factor (sigma-70 family)
VHLAEDLVQDAWVAALERPPRDDRPLRGWLATVLRNRWRDLGRERGWRERRERAAARDEALPSAHELVERASVQRTLVEAVLELEEPYRSTVLLRFFEGLPQREIARRTSTSVATVNSRLTRAPSDCASGSRAAADARHGSRSSPRCSGSLRWLRSRPSEFPP